MERKEEDEEEIVCLDESFFINDDYQLTTFTFGSQVIQLFCLHSASTDFDLTGQLVWPGAMLLNDYLSKNAKMLQGCSVIELGSGVGITGILCNRFCRDFVLTDHNDEVLKILQIRGKGQCKFMLAYVSRAKIMDSLVISEATRHGMQITEVAGTRCVVGNLDGVIFEVTLQ